MKYFKYALSQYCGYLYLHYICTDYTFHLVSFPEIEQNNKHLLPNEAIKDDIDKHVCETAITATHTYSMQVLVSIALYSIFMMTQFVLNEVNKMNFVIFKCFNKIKKKMK